MKRVIAGFGLVLIGSLQGANAITFTTTGLGDNVNVSYTDGQGAGSHNGFGGELIFNDGITNFSTLCVDLRAGIGGGATWNAATHTLTNADGNLNYAGAVMAGNLGSVSTNEQWAGLQLAVWEATYDGVGGNLSTGNFIVNGATANELSLASAYLLNPNYTIPVTFYSEEFNGNGALVGGQAQIRVVPEPASMTALGLGVAAILRKRRKSKGQ